MKGSAGVIWRLARRQPLIYALHVFFALLDNNVHQLIPPLLMREFLNRLGAGQANVWWLLVAYAAVPLNDAFAAMLSGPVDARMHETAGSMLRRNMLEGVMKRPGARALPSSPGEALVRFRDDPEMVGQALFWFAEPLGFLITIVVTFLVMGSINLFLTVVVIVPALIVMFIVNLATPRIREARRLRQKTLGQVSGLLGEAFNSVAAIKAADAEQHVTRKLRELNDLRRRASLRDLIVELALGSVYGTVVSIATGAILLLVAASARAGSFTAGDLALFTAYVGRLATVCSYAGLSVTLLRQSGVSVDRMSEVLQTEDASRLVARGSHLRGPLPELPAYDRGTEILHSLEVKGLTFRYSDTGRGITDVDFSINAGEFVVITGRIGSGKTTLVRAVLGLLPRDSGEVRWNGRAIMNPGEFLVPPHAAYTPQVPRLFSMELAENVLLGIDGDLEAAAYAAVLEKDLVDLEDGWRTRVGPRGLKLSGGQIQRTAAARMFVRDAQLLVFDDLSSALDVETEQKLWSRLYARAIQPTCLVVSHRPWPLQKADQVLLMDGGRLVARGALKELLATSELMRRLWRSEAATDEFA